MPGAVRVVPAGRAVARRGARHRIDPSVSAGVQGRIAGHLDHRAPAAVHLAGHEPLEVPEPGAVRVEPAGRASARRGARHRGDPAVPAGVQGRRAGHHDRRAPAAVHLAGHPRLEAPVQGLVGPAGHAVPRRAARHRADPGFSVGVQRRRAGHLDRRAPLGVPGAVKVEPAGRAVARRGARHHADLGFSAGVQPPQARYLDRPAPHRAPRAGLRSVRDRRRRGTTGRCHAGQGHHDPIPAHCTPPAI